MDSLNSSSTAEPNISLIIEMLRQALANGESPSLKVISNSMAPVLWANDLVTLRQIDFESIQKGDIITLTQREALTTHRVVARRKGEIVTRGDRNFILDEPVTHSQILGKVTKIKSHQSSGIIDLDAPKNQYRLTIISRLTTLEYNLHTRSRNFAKLFSVLVRAVIRRLIQTMKKQHQGIS